MNKLKKTKKAKKEIRNLLKKKLISFDEKTKFGNSRSFSNRATKRKFKINKQKFSFPYGIKIRIPASKARNLRSAKLGKIKNDVYKNLF